MDGIPALTQAQRSQRWRDAHRDATDTITADAAKYALVALVTNADASRDSNGRFATTGGDGAHALLKTPAVTETLVLTFDFFPGQADPRNLLNYQLGYAYDQAPWWWYGFSTKDSIELVRRPVQSSLSPLVAPTVTYNDVNGTSQTLDPATYTVGYNKITLNVGCTWPLTDRRQDCIQVVYQAGYGDTATSVPSQLKLATLFLASHFYENRSIVTVEPTSEIHMTLMALLSSFRSYRIPR